MRNNKKKTSFIHKKSIFSFHHDVVLVTQEVHMDGVFWELFQNHLRLSDVTFRKMNFILRK